MVSGSPGNCDPSIRGGGGREEEASPSWKATGGDGPRPNEGGGSDKQPLSQSGSSAHPHLLPTSVFGYTCVRHKKV
ncbi:hypothetical protein NL676_032492 [Syzygium grande]|nr:hypothetical protein NL676_032492 [Syzygium grande]